MILEYFTLGVVKIFTIGSLQQQQLITIDQMPFVYKMEIKESKIDGKGVFSLEDIPRGAVIWVFQTPNPIRIIGHEIKQNRAYNQQELQSMEDKEELRRILHGGCYDKNSDLYLDLRDGTNFTNHSDNFNSRTVLGEANYKDKKIIAIKDILAGEEVTENYENFFTSPMQWIDKLYIQYLPNRKQIQDQFTRKGNIEGQQAQALQN